MNGVPNYIIFPVKIYTNLIAYYVKINGSIIPIDHQRRQKYAVLSAETRVEPLYLIKLLKGVPKFTDGITKIKRQCQSKSLKQIYFKMA